MHLQIDIAIVNYRGSEDTLQALSRLQGWAHGRVFVIDNSAHEPDVQVQTAELQVACAADACITLLQPGENLGFGQACNLAFEQSRAEYFLLLNPDARIAPQDIAAMADAMSTQPQWGATSPAIYWNTQHSFILPLAYPQSPPHTLSLALRTRSQTLARHLAARAVRSCQRQMDSRQSFTVPCLAGAVMLLRRHAVLEAGGLFDPRYFMFYEDTDLSLRLQRQGYELAMLPQCVAVHEYRHKAFKAPLMAQSQQQYFSKNFPRFFRLTRSLHWLAHLAKPQNLNVWFAMLNGPIASAAEFGRQTAGESVLAFSPSMLMVPAIVRPSGASASSFTTAEWELLEPAAYVALMQGDTASSKPRWVHFTKA
jgi:GT2 family glycosyltransferase